MFEPYSVEAWSKYAELESTLKEERARSIYELALKQPFLDLPELLWKSYLSYEIQHANRQRARNLYERLLQKTQHTKVWLGYANFEAKPLKMISSKANSLDNKHNKQTCEETPESCEPIAREIFHRAYRSLSNELYEHKEDVIMILNAWKKFEQSCVAETNIKRVHRVNEVEKKMPRKVNRKHLICENDGEKINTEKHCDYFFPEKKESLGLKLLKIAHKWKKDYCTKI